MHSFQSMEEGGIRNFHIRHLWGAVHMLNRLLYKFLQSRVHIVWWKEGEKVAPPVGLCAFWIRWYLGILTTFLKHVHACIINPSFCTSRLRRTSCTHSHSIEQCFDYIRVQYIRRDDFGGNFYLRPARLRIHIKNPRDPFWPMGHLDA